MSWQIAVSLALSWALACALWAADSEDPFDSAGTSGAVSPPCFVIPSASELGSNDQIVAYREQYQPVLYHPESPLWPWMDLGVLTALLLLGTLMVWRHVHARWFSLPATLTLVYFGFVRGGCICPVGSVANLARGLVHPERVAIFTAVMFLLPLACALAMGRVFCVAGCPMGALQHLLAAGRSRRLPVVVERVLSGLPMLTLIATAWLAIRAGCFLVCVLDPYKVLFFWGYAWLNRAILWCQGGLVEPGLLRVGDWTAWLTLLGAVLAGIWVHRPFCRYVCPYGVLLGALAVVAFKRRRIEPSSCVHCGICERSCPVHAIAHHPATGEFRISSFRCIQCNRCSSVCRKNGIA